MEARKVGSIPSIDRLRENNTREGFFSKSEMHAVVSHLPRYLQGLFETAYWTGWRTKSELVNRQWKHVDLKDGDGWLRLEPGEGKNKEGRTFPRNSPQLRAILERQRVYTNQLSAKTGRIVPWVFH